MPLFWRRRRWGIWTYLMFICIGVFVLPKIFSRPKRDFEDVMVYRMERYLKYKVCVQLSIFLNDHGNLVLYQVVI